MLAFARREGVYAFWAASPNTESGDVNMHWITEGGDKMVFKQDESRCILVSSGVGPAERMYADALNLMRVRPQKSLCKSQCTWQVRSISTVRRQARVRDFDCGSGRSNLHSNQTQTKLKLTTDT